MVVVERARVGVRPIVRAGVLAALEQGLRLPVLVAARAEEGGVYELHFEVVRAEVVVCPHQLRAVDERVRVHREVVLVRMNADLRGEVDVGHAGERELIGSCALHAVVVGDGERDVVGPRRGVVVERGGLGGRPPVAEVPRVVDDLPVRVERRVAVELDPVRAVPVERDDREQRLGRQDPGRAPPDQVGPGSDEPAGRNRFQDRPAPLSCEMRSRTCPGRVPGCRSAPRPRNSRPRRSC